MVNSANKLKLSVSAAALALLLTSGGLSAQAQDSMDPGCMLSGTALVGLMYDWQDFEISIEDKNADSDLDWYGPFFEGAGLMTCGGLNFQADVAYYDHSTEIDGKGEEFNVDAPNSHMGGVVFWRDPSHAALGFQGSRISQDLVGKDMDYYRIGVFGEFYLDEWLTLGASAAYFDDDNDLEGKDHDGFELSAFGRVYATPDFSLMLRGDLLLSDTQLGDKDEELNGFAITGEAEHLILDERLAVFAGARYAERDFDFDIDDKTGEVDFDFDIDDVQVFAGLKFYFGRQNTLVGHHRNGPVDNTSVFLEKLPNFLISTAAGLAEASSDIEP